LKGRRIVGRSVVARLLLVSKTSARLKATVTGIVLKLEFQEASIDLQETSTVLEEASIDPESSTGIAILQLILQDTKTNPLTILSLPTIRQPQERTFPSPTANDFRATRRSLRRLDGIINCSVYS
jgi:hypothetical protein